MKLITFIVTFLLCIPCYAIDLSDTLNKLPNMKQGIGYSLQDSTIEYLTTSEVAKYKDFSIEVGYTSEDAVIGVVSLNIINFRDYLTIDYLKEIEINLGIYGGFKRLGISAEQNESTWGISATLLNFTF